MRRQRHKEPGETSESRKISDHIRSEIRMSSQGRERAITAMTEVRLAMKQDNLRIPAGLGV